MSSASPTRVNICPYRSPTGHLPEHKLKMLNISSRNQDSAAAGPEKAECTPRCDERTTGGPLELTNDLSIDLGGKLHHGNAHARRYLLAGQTELGLRSSAKTKPLFPISISDPPIERIMFCSSRKARAPVASSWVGTTTSEVRSSVQAGLPDGDTLS